MPRSGHAILGSNGCTGNELKRVAAHAFAGKLRPVIDRVLPLAKTADGERALERREVFGKVVIHPEA